ncbi:DcaP family trimeric outer membrane transporter [Pseudoalteromonas xiamenensis]
MLATKQPRLALTQCQFALLALVHTPVLAASDFSIPISVSGMLKADAIYDLSGLRGDRADYLATQAGSDSPYSRFHMRESRLKVQWQDAQHNVSGVIEGDFFANGTHSSSSIERIANGDTGRLRHAYLSGNQWLIGQTWSNFVDVRSFPETLDFSNDTGQAFVRQTQIRYSQPWQQFILSASLENPESDVINESGVQTYSSDTLPDATVRLLQQHSKGHWSVQVILRQLSVTQNQQTHDVFGGGAAVSGRWYFSETTHLRWHFTCGKGLGRYLQEASGYAATFDGQTLDALTSKGGYLALQHHWFPTLRSNVSIGALKIDLPASLQDNQRLNTLLSSHINTIWKSSNVLEFGLEWSWFERAQYAQPTVTQHLHGSRLQASMKYQF